MNVDLDITDTTNGNWVILFKQRYFVEGEDDCFDNETVSHWAQIQLAGDLLLGKLCPSDDVAIQLAVRCYYL